MSEAIYKPSDAFNDRLRSQPKNAAKGPGSVAIRGAVLAFAPPQAQQTLNQNVGGARAAAVAAGGRATPHTTPSPIRSPIIAASTEATTPPETVSKRIETFERSARQGSSVPNQEQLLTRPKISRSPSAIAAQLASTTAAQHQRSVSLPRAHRPARSFSNGDTFTKENSRFKDSTSLKSKAKDIEAVGDLYSPTIRYTNDDQSLPEARSNPISPQPSGDAQRAVEFATSLKPPVTLPRYPSSRSKLSPSPLSRFQSASPEPRDTTALTDTSPSVARSQSIAAPPKPIALQVRRQSNTSETAPRSRPNVTSRRASSMAISSPVQDSHHGLTVSTLADAMVASSLASSRAPSPNKPIPPPPPRRHHSHSRSMFHHHNQPSSSDPSRANSPTKHGGFNLRQTLRAQPKSDDESEGVRGRRRHLVRKHPNKHHEGDRRRWRDEVTDRERRRYEGVWAANRDLFMSPSDSADWQSLGAEAKSITRVDRVVNLVVRDIWQRSRLSGLVLEEIWDLVAVDEEAGSLGKAEFVVGMWLIDQSLKGRKLPIRVSPSVWNSARRTLPVQLRRGEG
ncbi:MAG: hypothetical protein Q9227_008909 [Pyrenula ochraceoflavens]